MHSHDRTLLSTLGFADPDKKDTRHDLAIQYLAQSEVLESVLGSLNQEEAKREKWIGGLPIMRITPEFHITRGTYTVGFGDLFVQYRVLTEHEVSEMRKERIASQGEKEKERRREQAHREMLATWQVEYDRLQAAAVSGNEAPPVGVLGPSQRNYPDWEWKEDYAKRIGEPAAHRDMREIAQRAEELRNLVPIITWAADRERWIDETTEALLHGMERRMLFEVKIKPVGIGDALRQMALYNAHIPWSPYSGMGNYPNRLVLVTAYDVDRADADTLLSKGVRHIRLGKGFDAYCQQRSQSPQKSLSLEI